VVVVDWPCSVIEQMDLLMTVVFEAGLSLLRGSLDRASAMSEMEVVAFCYYANSLCLPSAPLSSPVNHFVGEEERSQRCFDPSFLLFVIVPVHSDVIQVQRMIWASAG
jgi:hypothetical protein